MSEVIDTSRGGLFPRKPDDEIEALKQTDFYKMLWDNLSDGVIYKTQNCTFYAYYSGKYEFTFVISIDSPDHYIELHFEKDSRFDYQKQSYVRDGLNEYAEEDWLSHILTVQPDLSKWKLNSE